MIQLRYESDDLAPSYMTAFSSGADLRSSKDMTIPKGRVAMVPTGVWIASYDKTMQQSGQIPELQVRARSSLAYKHAVTLANGVGTIDADYPNEIGVLLHNHGERDFAVKRGDRIAQLVLTTVSRIPDLAIGGERIGGFGSTGKT